MLTQQNQTKVITWPFPIVNDNRTQESQQLIDSKHYTTKEVLNTNDYEEAIF
jgi:hypothetical protein